MGTDATWPLEVSLVKRLGESQRLKEILGEVPRITDLSRSEKEPPFLVIGNSKANSGHSATFDGQEHELELHLWTREGGCSGSKAAASALIDELHNADFPVQGHALVDLQFESSTTRYIASRRLYHCTLTFKGLTVSD